MHTIQNSNIMCDAKKMLEVIGFFAPTKEQEETMLSCYVMNSGKKRKAETMFMAMEVHAAKKVAAASQELSRENFEGKIALIEEIGALKFQLKNPSRSNAGQATILPIDENKGASSADADVDREYGDVDDDLESDLNNGDCHDDDDIEDNIEEERIRARLTTLFKNKTEESLRNKQIIKEQGSQIEHQTKMRKKWFETRNQKEGEESADFSE